MRKDKNRIWYVYALIDPDTDEVRYVGKTHRTIKIRFKEHINQAKTMDDNVVKKYNRYCVNWIHSLLKQDKEPKIQILQQGDSSEDWAAAECHWIAYYRKISEKLTNLTEGGDGMPGYEFSDAQRAKRSATAKIVQNRPEVKEKRSKSIKETFATPESIAKRTQISKELWKDPEYAKKTLEALRAGCRTEQARKNKSIAQTIVHSKCEVIEKQKATYASRYDEKRKAEKSAQQSKPETIAKKSAAMKAAHARKKALKLAVLEQEKLEQLTNESDIDHE